MLSDLLAIENHLNHAHCPHSVKPRPVFLLC